MGCGKSKGLCPTYGRGKDDEDEAVESTAVESQAAQGTGGSPGLETPPPSPINELISPIQERLSILSKNRFEDVYQMSKEDVLGEGASAIVYFAVHRRSKRKVAVKCFDKTKMRDAEVKELFEEVHILKQMKHEHILELLDFYHEPNHYYIVTDLLEGGELFERIVDREFYSEKEARDLIKILLTAVEYMHSLNIVHRDLKPENILLKSMEDDTSIKICDFGFAKFDEEHKLTAKCGSPYYIAPEILTSKHYGREVDIWSAGVITYILLCGYPPFQGATDTELLAMIKRGHYEFDAPYWDDVSELAKSFVSSILVMDPLHRPSASELLKHEWITGYASTTPLKTVAQELKRFNARRKFKAAVKTVQATVSLLGRTRTRGASAASDAILHPRHSGHLPSAASSSDIFAAEFIAIRTHPDNRRILYRTSDRATEVEGIRQQLKGFMGCNFSVCSGPRESSEPVENLSETSVTTSMVVPVAVSKPVAFREKYTLGGALGEGSYAVVKKARRKEDGKEFAVKIFKKENLSPGDERDILSEVDILGRLNHTNVLNLVDFFAEAKYYYIVTDLCDGGELFDRISQLSYYTEKEARDLVKTLLLAIKYCHDQGIVHRDLKPENILMTDKVCNSSIKIADFGFAKAAVGGLTTTCGSPEYVAPEIISRPEDEKTYGTAVDIWSIGVITYVLLAGYTPFHDENQSTLFDNICNGRFYYYSPDWDEISDEAKDFVTSALTIDPKQRPSASDLLNDPWIVQENVSIYQLSSVMEKLPMLKTGQQKFKAAVNATMLVNKLKNRISGADEMQSV